MSWDKSACSYCSIDDCKCRECSWNYTHINDSACDCRKPYNKKCPITGTTDRPNTK